MKPIVHFPVALSFLTLFSGCVAVPTTPPSARVAPTAPVDTGAPAVQFDRLVVSVPPGYRIGDLRTGVFCRVRQELLWDGDPARFAARPFVDLLEDKFTRAGVSVAPRPQGLFAPAAGPDAALQIGGRVEAVEAHLCLPLAAYGTPLHSKGTAYLRIRWQLHAPAQQRIVLERTTEGTAALAGARSEWELIATAYSDAVDRLLIDPGFRRALRPAGGASMSPASD
jgi:hypothetical protein